jgi:3-hydroxybutyryl-CoA dehydrogenase
VEDIAVKRELFRALEDIVAPEAILASNTSSFLVAEIASLCRHPGRVAGLHFFNPVPLMKLAEVIAAVRTSPATVATLTTLINATGHRAVVAADQPGFLVNHAGRGLTSEALHILQEQVASPADIDFLLRDAAGFRMGPFELLDLTGMDVSGKVMESIYQQFHQEPRFRPSSLVPPRIAAGLFGRKAGEGWYIYDNNKKRAEPAREIPTLPEGLKLWIDPASANLTDLQKLAAEAGCEITAAAHDAAVLIVQPWGEDATSYSAAHGLDATKVVAIDPLPGFDKRLTLMLTIVTTPAVRDAALAFLSSGGAAVTVINDSAGFVVQRVLAMVVNIGANLVQRGIATVADLEDAVQLGLSYPRGSLSWGDLIGGEKILTILRNIYTATGDPRYRPSPWLVRRVSLGLSLRTPETPR